ncbi:MAG TPA: RluA family pseudouridine synthase [Holophagaceae bacterium]|jgi:23S rRNA pseudouridine1911/1915/1917 synthase|nr:RluA family pseudouridine synthase [Holophagaceae bacterium]
MAKLDQAWTVEAHHAGSALAAELHRRMGVSHRQAKGLIDARCVMVNGETATKYGARVESGDKVAVVYDPELKYDPLPPLKGAVDGSFKSLWEDTHLLFVDKPAGLLTVPAENGGEPSLADAVSDHYRRRGMKHAQLYIVHRLDRFTSGVLVFARTSEALHHLKKLFAMHKLQRTYRAILVGELPENQGTLKGHLIEQAKTMKMRVVDPKRKDAEGAQSAVTHYRVVERLPGHTVVEVELETGRRNQIRVQFADRGFPLLGDQVYGEESPLLDRQALHAEVLGVKHPITEEMIVVKAPLPKDFEAALKTLRARTRLVRAAAGEKGAEEAPKPARAASASDRPRFQKGGAKPPFDKTSGERPAPGKKPFRPRTEGGEDRPRKSFADRGAKPRSGERPAPGKKPFRPRPEGAEDHPRKPYADRDAKPRSDERPAPGKKPFRPRPEGAEERPRPKRFEGAKPKFEDRPRKERPRREDGPREDRPRASRPTGDRPRPAGRPRPEGRTDASSGERPRRSFDRNAPRSGAPARPRRESGAINGPRGAKPESRSGGKPGFGGGKPRTGPKPGPKSGPKSGGRKPFVKKRG